MKWIRPSGSEIELSDTPNLNEYAKAGGFKKADTPKRKRRSKEEMIADGDSGASNQSNTSGNTSTS